MLNGLSRMGGLRGLSGVSGVSGLGGMGLMDEPRDPDPLQRQATRFRPPSSVERLRADDRSSSLR
ncbi:hypothetical protein GCM10017600_45290 [Streptosporangium carneum]|uniref:Uncharacterized protein n=1 Tax=Streptosporangium carneum TaxID=47481 RepID=A0A9W6I4Q1_9ACTN|nr:hypothetical protein GCM10017600_45290 [Streptosporangium carneum]